MGIDRGEVMPATRTGVWTSDTERQLREQEKRRARLAVAHHATGPQDCANLLRLLGLHPDQGDREIAR